MIARSLVPVHPDESTGLTTWDGASAESLEQALTLPATDCFEGELVGRFKARVPCNLSGRRLLLVASTGSAYRYSIAKTFVAALAARLPISGEVRERVHTALHEALMNAVLHGNLGLDSELRDTLEGLASMHQAIDARLGLAHVARLAVCMQAWWTERMLIITIEDSGAGFSPEGVVIVGDGLPADHRARGRGLMILNTLCDGIDFSHGGCVIELTFRL